jgi:2-polyprenyl-3-methyl-5-hydroxy-6-metoxy-1,4-benzoquinol methylase
MLLFVGLGRRQASEDRKPNSARQMFTELQYQLLKRISPGEARSLEPDFYQGGAKLKTLLGETLVRECKGKTVVDFGCGEGSEAVELARCGARRVIGVDIRDDVLEIARREAMTAGVDSVCSFTTEPEEPAAS